METAAFTSLWTNVRLALRDIARRPTFAAAILLTLTISLGATIAAFAFIDAVFLTRLPVRDQNRLVVMTAKNDAGQDQYPVTWEKRAQLAQRQRAFSSVTAFSFGAFPFCGPSWGGCCNPRMMRSARREPSC